MLRRGKVIVAMSGGVDSSVAASLLCAQGYECVGVFMRVGKHGGEERQRGNEATRQQGVESEDRSEKRGSLRSAGATGGLPTSASGSPEPTADAEPGRHGADDDAPDAIRYHSGADDARGIADRLGIPLHVLDFEADFGQIVEYFVDEYARGRTPNPCIVCNSRLKFGKLLRFADELGAEYVATGHYAQILREPAGVRLARAVHSDKDQSYVLFSIRRDDLRRCLLPIGEIADKAEVRRVAETLGLQVHDKPESQEICFVPDDDYKRLVRERRPETLCPGEIRDAAGRTLGRHAGIVNYTIGQRRGLGIAAARPLYVTRLDAASHTVYVGPREELLSAGLIANRINWLTDPPPPDQPQRVSIRIRYQHAPAPGSIRLLAGGDVEARFDEPQPAVTPGQAAVFYGGDIVLGGGWIRESLPATA
ncbi:MAG: tRNA 2-thiouridine(34) synthase MnmA [Phycisphaerae bacterium]|jgi:tRNA-specific 2-thiouridylase